LFALTIAGALVASGIAFTSPHRLGDFVWIDTNRDGLQDPDEPGMPGVPVIVRNSQGAEVGTATTDGTGHYLVEGLPDGSHMVCFGISSLPYADYAMTRADVGDDGARDSDAGPDGCTGPLTLTPGRRESRMVDAGIVSPLNRLGDFVWVDLNVNGLQDAGEPGMSGVRVVVKDGNGNQVGAAATDGAGGYLVGDLPDGTFTACFGIAALPGYRATVPNAGNEDVDSDVYASSGCTAPVNLGPGNRENPTVDLGIVLDPTKWTRVPAPEMRR
jgi:hypothetical protein